MTDAVVAPVAGASLPELRLKQREDRRISAGHLWIFSNEVDTGRTPLTSFASGALCRVVGDRDRFLGYAYVNPHALICARILGRDPTYPPGKSLFVHRLQVALALRERSYSTPWYRLAYGESDGLPGVVFDRFGDVIVGQIGTAGMEARKPELLAALEQVLAPSAVIWKNDGGSRELEGLPVYVETALGEPPEHAWLEENGVRFKLSLGRGQKTGWFYDQAANRRAMLAYARDARVLDVFAYLGAWGLAAAHAGARDVLCVDSSAAALAQLEESAAANGLAVRTLRDDAFDALAGLRAAGEKFDLVIVDPPAFVKSKKDLAQGLKGYRKMVRLAAPLVAEGGYLLAASCSHHADLDSFAEQVRRGLMDAGREGRVLRTSGAAPDHPVHPALPESAYLKAQILALD